MWLYLMRKTTTHKEGASLRHADHKCLYSLPLSHAYVIVSITYRKSTTHKWRIDAHLLIGTASQLFFRAICAGSRGSVMS